MPPPLPTLQNSVFRNVLCKRAKGYRPLLRFSGPEGRPSFLFLTSSSPLPHLFLTPRNRGGWRADRAHCPDYSGRVSGLLRTMGVKRHAPRLASRQRGILSFVPLTVVGPCRLLG